MGIFFTIFFGVLGIVVLANETNTLSLLFGGVCLFICLTLLGREAWKRGY